MGIRPVVLEEGFEAMGLGLGLHRVGPSLGPMSLRLVDEPGEGNGLEVKAAGCWISRAWTGLARLLACFKESLLARPCGHSSGLG